MPQVIVVDEIGTELEALAARTIAQRGVQLVATCHGHELRNIMKNPSLVDLVGGIQSVTLGDEEARRRGLASKSVLERQSPPTFGCAVEMLSIGRWRVHLDVGAAVDALLVGKEPATQVRRVGRDGKVTVEEEAGASASGSQQTAAASAGAGPQAAPGRHGAAPPAAAGPPALRLFCHGIDSEALARVVSTLGLDRSVALTAQLEEADCILALRSRLGRAGADDWLRLSARSRGVPLYAIKTDSLSQLVRALKTITGAAAAAPQLDAATEEGLEEARLACEREVIPAGTPVDLLPRAPHILEAQRTLVDLTYRLTTVTLGGSGGLQRLRILPVYTTQAAV